MFWHLVVKNLWEHAISFAPGKEAAEHRLDFDEGVDVHLSLDEHGSSLIFDHEFERSLWFVAGRVVVFGCLLSSTVFPYSSFFDYDWFNLEVRLEGVIRQIINLLVVLVWFVSVRESRLTGALYCHFLHLHELLRVCCFPDALNFLFDLHSSDLELWSFVNSVVNPLLVFCAWNALEPLALLWRWTFQKNFCRSFGVEGVYDGLTQIFLA